LKYANSNHIDEQRFYQLLVQDLLPKILPALDEHEKEIKRQEALIHRKRSSRIMIKELESLEQPSSRISNRIEKKAQEKEQQEKERLARAREERLLERERRIMEREYRILAKEKSQPAEEPIAVEKVAEKTEDEEPKPKRKYTKRPKFDEHGNPIPRKPKLDKDGNVIPLKKRGRKPKNRDPIEESWVFECVCGVSGKNLVQCLIAIEYIRAYTNSCNRTMVHLWLLARNVAFGSTSNAFKNLDKLKRLRVWIMSPLSVKSAKRSKTIQ
jgi:hypothetical protein